MADIEVRLQTGTVCYDEDRFEPESSKIHPRSLGHKK